MKYVEYFQAECMALSASAFASTLNCAVVCIFLYDFTWYIVLNAHMEAKTRNKKTKSPTTWTLLSHICNTLHLHAIFAVPVNGNKKPSNCWMGKGAIFFFSGHKMFRKFVDEREISSHCPFHNNGKSDLCTYLVDACISIKKANIFDSLPIRSYLHAEIWRNFVQVALLEARHQFYMWVGVDHSKPYQFLWTLNVNIRIGQRKLRCLVPKPFKNIAKMYFSP